MQRRNVEALAESFRHPREQLSSFSLI